MPETLTIERLVAATAARQIYRARGGEAEWAVIVLPKAHGSPAGWGARLEVLPAGAPKLRALGLAPIEQVGMIEGVAAVTRPWTPGQSAVVLVRGQGDGLPPLLTLLSAVDLATALERLHGAGLYHGDVSPESAVIGVDGRLTLAEVGLAPALSGKEADPTADLRGLGRTLYLWLTGRDVTLGPDEPLPADFGLPSRLDRRVPAQADSLVLRALQAGGPRGLKTAAEMVAGLRQVLRSAGAAVSPADVASWVAKRAGATEAGSPALLRSGQTAVLQPLVERRQAPRSVADTLVDQPIQRAPVQPKGAPRRPAAAEVPLRPLAVSTADATETSQSSSKSISTMTRPARRRAFGGFAAAALVCGVVALGYALGDRGARARGAKSPALPSPLLPAMPLPSMGQGPQPQQQQAKAAPPAAPLPTYDPNAPVHPKAPPKKPAHERAEVKLGRGAFLSLESNRVARVFVDGRDTRLLTPVIHVPISPGAHRIRLVAALGEDGSQEFEIKIRRGATAYRYGNLGE
ncbi:MAG: serine/threonine-protein kinase [Myxococcales bacterium]